MSFPKILYRAKTPLELVHTDIFGTPRMSSLNDNRYFILFIDDHTRMIWIYFLKQKSKVFSTFLKFKAIVESQNRYKLKILHTDRRGEYISNEFQDYCKQVGIKR